MEPHGRTRRREYPRGRCASVGWIVTGLFDGLSDCANYASDRMHYIYLLGARFNPTIGRSVASAFIDGVLHRETSNWNHKLNDYTFLDSTSWW